MKVKIPSLDESTAGLNLQIVYWIFNNKNSIMTESLCVCVYYWNLMGVEKRENIIEIVWFCCCCPMRLVAARQISLCIWVVAILCTNKKKSPYLSAFVNFNFGHRQKVVKKKSDELSLIISQMNGTETKRFLRTLCKPNEYGKWLLTWSTYSLMNRLFNFNYGSKCACVFNTVGGLRM